jgi:hypothetical protein
MKEGLLLMAKDFLELMDEFNEYGYVLHECNECGEECNPTEADSNVAYCESCDKLTEVDPLV